MKTDDTLLQEAYQAITEATTVGSILKKIEMVLWEEVKYRLITHEEAKRAFSAVRKELENTELARRDKQRERHGGQPQRDDEDEKVFRQGQSQSPAADDVRSKLGM